MPCHCAGAQRPQQSPALARDMPHRPFLAREVEIATPRKARLAMTWGEQESATPRDDPVFPYNCPLSPQPAICSR